MTGTEWIIDIEGCSAEGLSDLARLRSVCARIVDELGLNVVGEPLWHQFPGAGGVTGLYLLSESHLACHTFPEYGTATFNLYCCRPRPEWDWHGALTAELGAAAVRVRRVERGVSGSASRVLTASGESR
jgi:S-adenosylmethionine decarboxylase